MTEAPARIRLDKWLWQARFVKSRALAAHLVTGAHVRVNGIKAAKPAQQVGPGDVLTFALGGRVRVVRILAPGVRRGPATEAQTLYDDLSDPLPETPATASPVYDNLHGDGGRPTKRDRRKIDAARRTELE